MANATFMHPAVPGDIRARNLLVLAWTSHYFGADYLEPVEVPNPHGPDIRMEFTADRTRLAEADAVWFHGPSIADPPAKMPGQKWIMMSMESDVNYPVLALPELRHIFDITMTYRLDSDVPCLYPTWREYGSFLDIHGATRKEESLAVYIASNPVRYRDDYVRELMHYISIDSLGSCLNNRSVDDFVTGGSNWGNGGWESILAVLPNYKFYLAFENSVTLDYVTERVFHALVCGTVPVYLGAPNVREFMPDDNALIVASEFETHAALADYLKYLDGNDEAYRAHISWKTTGYSQRFAALLDLGNTNPKERLAVKLAHGCDRECRCGGRWR